MYAIIEVVNKLRQYLIGRHFHKYTDQKSLKNLLVQTIQTPEHQKWAAKLQRFNFDILYKLGKSNQVTNALSRRLVEDEATLLYISSLIPVLVTQLRQYYKIDEQGIFLMNKVLSDPNTYPLFLVKDELLYYKEKHYIPEVDALQHKIISEYHSTPVASHSKLQPTLVRLSSSFL